MKQTVVVDRRNLLVGAVGLILRFKLKGEGPLILEARNEIEVELVRNSFLASAPFKTVSLIFRYGYQDQWEPDGYEINNATQVLNVAIEFNGEQLLQLTPEEIKAKFRLAMIDVLCDVAANYNLPYEFLDRLRERRGGVVQQAVEGDGPASGGSAP